MGWVILLGEREGNDESRAQGEEIAVALTLGMGGEGRRGRGREERIAMTFSSLLGWGRRKRRTG